MSSHDWVPKVPKVENVLILFKKTIIICSFCGDTVGGLCKLLKLSKFQSLVGFELMMVTNTVLRNMLLQNMEVP